MMLYMGMKLATDQICMLCTVELNVAGQLFKYSIQRFGIPCQPILKNISSFIPFKIKIKNAFYPQFDIAISFHAWLKAGNRVIYSV